MKDELDVSEEELLKLLNDAGADSRVIKDGVSGQSIANRALATLISKNFKAVRSLGESSKRLELFTIILIVITLLDVLLKFLGK